MKSSTLQGRVLIASLIAGSLATIAVIWWYYALQREAIGTAMSQELAAIGDEFIQTGPATILLVPSALAPTEFNWLVSPSHPGFSKIKVATIEPFEYDSRLFESRRPARPRAQRRPRKPPVLARVPG